MKRVFAVGDLNLDVLCALGARAGFGTEAALRGLEFSLGGNAANFAYAAARLGMDARLVSAVGNDFITPFLKDSLKDAGVKAELLHKKGANGCSVILVKKDGERAIYSVKGILGKITAHNFEKMLLPKLRHSDIAYFGGYFHLRSAQKGFPALLRKVKEKGCLVAFDLCYDEHGEWKLGGLLKHIDILFLNNVELEYAAQGRGKDEKIAWLLKKGVRRVVLKEGSAGASVHSTLGERFERAIRTKAIDTTGAGDVFNAGFIYGKVNGYSDRICLKIGNFAAGRKVGRSGLAVPDEQEVEKFISREKLTGLEIVEDYGALSKAAAAEVIEQVRERPDSTIGLPAGRTPTGMYIELVKAYKKGRVDFSKARFFGLDEYAGRRKKEWDSFAHEIDEGLFREVNVKNDNVFQFNGNARNLNSECARFESFIGRAGIDLVVLGIGNNGHVAFNEPGTSFSSRAHVVKLSTNTINANARGGSLEDVPKKAVTVGLKSIMDAKRILLIANGKNKANAIKRAYVGKVGKGCPASILQRHRNTTFLVDKAAAKNV